MKTAHGPIPNLKVDPSHEVRAIAEALSKALNDGRMATLPQERRTRLAEIGFELLGMADAEHEDEQARLHWRLQSSAPSNKRVIPIAFLGSRHA
jgi:hypothetical protein